MMDRTTLLDDDWLNKKPESPPPPVFHLDQVLTTRDEIYSALQAGYWVRAIHPDQAGSDHWWRFKAKYQIRIGPGKWENRELLPSMPWHWEVVRLP